MPSRQLQLTISSPSGPARVAATVLLVVAGILLVTNTIWLFPDDGDLAYTYERADIEIEDDLLSYDRPGLDYLVANDLNSVDCTLPSGTWRNERLCAFDRYILENGPVTVPGDYDERIGGYTLVDGAYYERVNEETEPESTFDLERVSPEDLVAAIATDVSQIDENDPAFDDIPREYQIAVTGETTTTTTELDEEDVGEVFRRGDAYYTVVVTNHERIDRPMILGARWPLVLLGLLFLFLSFTQVVDRIDWVE